MFPCLRRFRDVFIKKCSHAIRIVNAFWRLFCFFCYLNHNNSKQFETFLNNPKRQTKASNKTNKKNLPEIFVENFYKIFYSSQFLSLCSFVDKIWECSKKTVRALKWNNEHSLPLRELLWASGIYLFNFSDFKTRMSSVI